MALSELPYTERLIIRRIVQTALESGFVVSVQDGETWVLILSDDETAICREVGATDQTNLRFRNPAIRDDRGNPATVGTVYLVHSNGVDVIADHTDNPEMERLLRPALDLAERLAA